RRSVPGFVFAPDERGRVCQVAALRGLVQREEVTDQRSGAGRAPAGARRALPGECIESIVDGDLITTPDRAPCEHLDAATHRVGLARVIEEGPRRQKDRASVPIELA